MWLSAAQVGLVFIYHQRSETPSKTSFSRTIGLVGGWIVQHLLWRGEDPAAIRILDLCVPTRPEVWERNVRFVQTDVADRASVSEAFDVPWPSAQVAALPLTIFHTVAYIKPTERTADFLHVYLKVNVFGTLHVLEAAKAAGATCVVATSSGSVGVKPPQFFLPPWRRRPRDMFQVVYDAGPPKGLDAPIDEFGSCYAFSKARAEKLVREADNRKNGFRTGCVRPGHAIYAHGVENASNLSWDYLRKGGTPSCVLSYSLLHCGLCTALGLMSPKTDLRACSRWIWDVLLNLVNAQNVSIAHLAFEARLVAPATQATPDVGGRSYYCTDPGGPITFGDLYRLLRTLAHPTTTPKFSRLPPAPMLVVAHLLEAYSLLRCRYFKFLPELPGDLALLTPAIFNLSTVHLVYDDSLTREELGYRPAVGTMEGLCLQLIEWNDKVEREIDEAKRTQVTGDEAIAADPPGNVSPAVPVWSAGRST